LSIKKENALLAVIPGREKFDSKIKEKFSLDDKSITHNFDNIKGTIFKYP
jgi:hypothetical protein